jgi:small-conductance mechanosensitive channel
MPETVEEISQQPDVRKELQRTTGKKRQRIKARGKDKLWFIVHMLILAGCAAAYFLLESKLIPLAQGTLGIAGRVLRGVALITVVLAIARVTSVYVLARIEDASTRFTLQRIVHLVVAIAIAVIVVSIIFVNWYAAIAALGVGSIIIGLAVQTP